MDLKQLEYFLAVAEERSVTRAAVRLHLTQPPLSAQLARLEHELGVPLLIRHRRGVDLTEAGRVLAERARRLLAEAEATAEEVTGTGQGRSGRLTVAFVAATARPLLVPLLRRFRDDRPDVRVRLVEDGADAVAGHVRERRAELGLLYLPPAGAAAGVGHDLDVAVVRREPLVAVLPARPPRVSGTGSTSGHSPTRSSSSLPAPGRAPWPHTSSERVGCPGSTPCAARSSWCRPPSRWWARAPASRCSPRRQASCAGRTPAPSRCP